MATISTRRNHRPKSRVLPTAPRAVFPEEILLDFLASCQDHAGFIAAFVTTGLLNRLAGKSVKVEAQHNCKASLYPAGDFLVKYRRLGAQDRGLDIRWFP